MSDSGLKYRFRISSTINKGLYKALYNHSIDSGVPLSRILDKAIEDYLQKNSILFTWDGPYKRERIL